MVPRGSSATTRNGILAFLVLFSALAFSSPAPQFAHAAEQKCHDQIHLAVSYDRPTAATATMDRAQSFASTATPLFKLGALASLVKLSNNTLVAYFLDFSRGSGSPTLKALSSSDSGVCWSLFDITISNPTGASNPLTASELISFEATTGPFNGDNDTVRFYFVTSSAPKVISSAVTDGTSGHLQLTTEVGSRYTLSTGGTTASVTSTHLVQGYSTSAAGAAAGLSWTLMLQVAAVSGTEMHQVSSVDGGISFPILESINTAWSHTGFGILPSPGGNMGQVRLYAHGGSEGALYSYTTTVNTSATTPAGFTGSQFTSLDQDDAAVVLAYPSDPAKAGARLSNPNFVQLANGSYLALVTYSWAEGRSSSSMPCSTSITYDIRPQATMYGPQCAAANVEPSAGKTIGSPGTTFMTPLVKLIILISVCVLTLVVLVVIAVVLEGQCGVKATDVDLEKGKVWPTGGQDATSPPESHDCSGAPSTKPNNISPAAECLHTPKEYKDTVTYDEVELMDADSEGPPARRTSKCKNDVPYHATSTPNGVGENEQMSDANSNDASTATPTPSSSSRQNGNHESGSPKSKEAW